MSLWYINGQGVALYSVGQMLPGKYEFGKPDCIEHTRVTRGWMVVNGEKFKAGESFVCQPGEDIAITTRVTTAWFTRFEH